MYHVYVVIEDLADTKFSNPRDLLIFPQGIIPVLVTFRTLNLDANATSLVSAPAISTFFLQMLIRPPHVVFPALCTGLSINYEPSLLASFPLPFFSPSAPALYFILFHSLLCSRRNENIPFI